MSNLRHKSHYICQDEATCLHYMTCGDVLLCGLVKGGIQAFTFDGGSFSLPNNVHSNRISFMHSSERLLAVGSKDRSVSLWKAKIGDGSTSGFSLICKLPHTREWEQPVRNMDLGSKFLVIGHGLNTEGYLALWRRRRFEEIPAKSDEVQLASGVTSVNLHEVEDVVLCSLENGDVLIYAMRSDAQKTRLEQTKVLKLSSPVVCMQVLSGEDGTLLMTGKDGVFSLDRHLSERKIVHSSKDAEELIQCLCTQDTIFFLSSRGGLFCMERDAVLSGGLNLDDSTVVTRVLPPKRIAYQGPQRMATALDRRSKVFCINPEDWRQVLCSQFNAV